MGLNARLSAVQNAPEWTAELTIGAGMAVGAGQSRHQERWISARCVRSPSQLHLLLMS